jgi:hypothetical protein
MATLRLLLLMSNSLRASGIMRSAFNPVRSGVAKVELGTLDPRKERQLVIGWYLGRFNLMVTG